MGRSISGIFVARLHSVGWYHTSGPSVAFSRPRPFSRPLAVHHVSSPDRRILVRGCGTALEPSIDVQPSTPRSPAWVAAKDIHRRHHSNHRDDSLFYIVSAIHMQEAIVPVNISTWLSAEAALCKAASGLELQSASSPCFAHPVSPHPRRRCTASAAFFLRPWRLSRIACQRPWIRSIAAKMACEK